MRGRFKRFLYLKLQQWFQSLQPKPDYKAENRLLNAALNDAAAEAAQLRRQRQQEAAEFAGELLEARQMAGTGPWRISPATMRQTDALISCASRAAATGTTLREAAMELREDATPPISTGSYGDIELALQNVEWRREVNLSLWEFSRWGIQQIILISRLYYVKHPWIQRGVNIASAYVFGRGVEISSPDEAANEVLRDWQDRNRETLGQIGLTDLMRRKYYDGNIFFACFPDDTSDGTVEVRTIDATEMQDIVTDPNDTDRPWLYRREWSQNKFNIKTGTTERTTERAWHPSLRLWLALKKLSDEKLPEGAPQLTDITINGDPVLWNAPVHHRKCGAIAKWHFGCPLVYAALDWARAGRRFLEACCTVKLALAQFAATITTKGGQPAIEGIKQQLGTTVGPSSALLDQNPTAVNASIFASGPGTKLEAFKSSGAGGDPSEVKEYRNLVACVLRIPPTYLADMETSNLATATTLDRPTELGFLEMQEEWREDLITLARFALLVSKVAPSGRIRESITKAKREKVVILEAPREIAPDGWQMRYTAAGRKPAADKIQVLVTFPAIREGDVKQVVESIVTAMTLDNKNGSVVGIDEKAGVFSLSKTIGIEGAEELVEAMYPEKTYDPERSAEPEPAAVPAVVPAASIDGTQVAEAFSRLIKVIREAKRKVA